MTRRRLPIIIAILLLLTSAGCADRTVTRPNDPSPYAREAIARARTDAQKAIMQSPGTMAQEKAILEIHARASRLQQSGDSATARLYLTTAITLLDSAAVFQPIPQ